MHTVKKILIMASILITSNGFGDMDYYVGARTGVSNITLESTINGTTSTGSQNANFFSIVNGVIVDDRVKLSVGYSQYAIANNDTMNSIELGYTYYWNNISYQLEKNDWRPFLNFEYVRSTLERSNINTNSDTIILGFGTDYHINKSLFLVAGYGFSLFSANSNNTQQIKDISKASLDLNYKF